MRIRLAIAALALGATALYAQSTTPQTPPAGTQEQTGSGTAQSATPPRTMHHGMHGNMSAMHAQQMQNMKQQVEKMRSLLEQMKANAAGLTGKDKAAMDANVQLWQMMIDHMDQMVNHMSSMGMSSSDEGMMMQHHHQGATEEKPAPEPPK